MNSYTVIDVSAPLRLAALLDSLGRRHVVHLAAEIPEVGVQLEGPALSPRLSTLMAAGSGQVYAISVDALECGELDMLERLHPASVPGGPGNGSAPKAPGAPRGAKKA